MLKQTLLISMLLVASALHGAAASEVEEPEMIGPCTLSLRMVNMGEGQQHLYLCVATRRIFAKPVRVDYYYVIRNDRISITLTGIYVPKVTPMWPPYHPIPAEAAVDLTAALLETQEEAGAPFARIVSKLKSGIFKIEMEEQGHGSRPIHLFKLASFSIVADEQGNVKIDEDAAQKRDKVVGPLNFAAREWKFDGKTLTEVHGKSADDSDF